MSQPTPPSTSKSGPDEAHGPHTMDDEAAISPSDPTTGYKFNHTMLRIRDPARSLHFYIDLMGMRTVFTMNTGPFTIYYLGYPQTTEHRADLARFREDTVARLPDTLGLFELYHVHGSENEPEGYHSNGNQPPNLGLGHLGFSVLDVPLALERLKAHGVEVIKDLGSATREDVPLSSWEAGRGIGLGDLTSAYKNVFEQIAFVKGPDGYIVELVTQNLQGL
ncbi:Lactoylglutathione lyase [Colletotrichum aenigma]|uniref:Lactoylglutathione lyase n=1 Tax=Colletotrichum aenigma TaxID=1215731 RepID=UPI001872CD12|nr:Lactoylglutathione lyase [Colletotrichum aenigma]KAF5522875.1 Lactoylglutathione lyase [Colletotrichum aenigma]